MKESKMLKINKDIKPATTSDFFFAFAVGLVREF